MSSANKKEYQKVMAIILERPGQRLPSERNLCESLNISRGHLRQILADFQSKGLIQRRHGSGTYATDLSAKSLKTVCFLIDADIKLEDDPFFSVLTDRLQREIQQQGRQCILHRVLPGGKFVFPLNCDGFVFLGNIPEKVMAEITSKSLPAVKLFPQSGLSGPRISAVRLDDVSGGRRAAEYLISKNIKKIFFLGRQDIFPPKLRFEGASAACKENGIFLELIPAKLNYNGGLQNAFKLAELVGDGPQGIIAANDWMALGVHLGLIQNGSDVRENYRIASFDGLDICKNKEMKITSFGIPVDDICTDTVAELIRLSGNPAAAARELVYQFTLP